MFPTFWVLFGPVVVWITNLHSCLNLSYVKGTNIEVKWQHKPLNMAPFLFCFLFSCPLLSFSLKVRVVSLPSFQRMTLSPMTRVTQTAAAVRVMMWTRKRSFWMSLWKGQPVLPTPTVLPKLPVPCSGLWGTPLAREPLEVLHPTPQHHLVCGFLRIFNFFFFPFIYRICGFIQSFLYSCFSFHSKFHGSDIYRPYQPTAFKCHQLQRCSCCSSSGS